ncbi:hypothetical protein ABI59_09300 [Acidobacteria bacterium Mor1]|nr:hypothetical protein ABI59_09300 [Acidobacteria bacterium Mor1]
MSECRRYLEEFAEREHDAEARSHLASCRECAAAHRAHEAIFRALRESDSGDERWQESVWQRIDQSGSGRLGGRLRGLALVAAALIALVGVAWLFTAGPEGPPELTARVLKGDAVRRGESAHPGDSLRISAKGVGPSEARVRLYRDGVLYWGCGDPEPCTRVGDVLQVTVPMETVGRYEAALFWSSDPIPPSTGELDRDAGLALEAGAGFELHAPIDVR